MEEIARLKEAARIGSDIGLGVNAGHGINYTNVQELFEVPHMEELNIGHSIVSRSIVKGLERAVREMSEIIAAYSFGR